MTLGTGILRSIQLSYGAIVPATCIGMQNACKGTVKFLISKIYAPQNKHWAGLQAKPESRQTGVLSLLNNS